MADALLPWPQELHDPACDASITLLNEMGLDPGIDHMLAMQCFDEVHSKGGKVGWLVLVWSGLYCLYLCVCCA